MGGGTSKQTPSCECNAETPDLPYDVYKAAKDGLPGLVVNFIENDVGNTGRNVNATYGGETMLHAACANGRDNVVNILLNESSLCLNVRDNYNQTALMLAAANGYRDCVETLLFCNHFCTLEVECKDNRNQTALDMAHYNNRQNVTYCMMTHAENCPPPMADKKSQQVPARQKPKSQQSAAAPRPKQPKSGNNTPASTDSSTFSSQSSS